MNNKLAYLAALPLILALSVPGHATDDAAKRDFVQYCASCHGLDGKGHGAVANAIDNAPADLTKLAQNNGGIFPYSKVRSIVDGRPDKGKIRVHGTEMPLWGKVFSEEQARGGLPYHAEAVAKMRILNIVDYISTIQEITAVKIEKAE